MEHWQLLALFLGKTFILVIAILVILAGILALLSKGKLSANQIKIVKLNREFEETRDFMLAAMDDKRELKRLKKEAKKAAKALQQEVKHSPDHRRKRVYVLDFCGDMKASQVSQLRNEITALLQIATVHDEVVVRLESPGGVVHGYGLAASQLSRLRERNIPLTVCVDKVAASGGYLMSCVANQIIAAPFAIIGSIGVVAQIPNVHRLLKKHHIDFEQVTAGEFKRTLSIFGENTDKAREKMRGDLEEIHTAFKAYIAENRIGVVIEQVATGEHWLATDALKLHLVDRLMTSDDYIGYASLHADVYSITTPIKRNLSQKLGFLAKTYLTQW